MKDTLDSLRANENEPLVVELPRTPGRKDAEYMHLFCGEIDVDSYAAKAATTASAKPKNNQLAELTERVSALETEVLELKRRLNEGA